MRNPGVKNPVKKKKFPKILKSGIPTSSNVLANSIQTNKL
jgi:hypothetical protein